MNVIDHDKQPANHATNTYVWYNRSYLVTELAIIYSLDSKVVEGEEKAPHSRVWGHQEIVYNC